MVDIEQVQLLNMKICSWNICPWRVVHGNLNMEKLLMDSHASANICSWRFEHENKKRLQNTGIWTWRFEHEAFERDWTWANPSLWSNTPAESPQFDEIQWSHHPKGILPCFACFQMLWERSTRSRESGCAWLLMRGGLNICSFSNVWHCFMSNHEQLLLINRYQTFGISHSTNNSMSRWRRILPLLLSTRWTWHFNSFLYVKKVHRAFPSSGNAMAVSLYKEEGSSPNRG